MSYFSEEIYLRVLNKLTVYHKETEGFTDFEGEKAADKHYPKQLNFIIGLLIEQNRLLERELGDIKERLQVLEDKKQKSSRESLPPEAFNSLAEELKKITLTGKAVGKYPPEKTRVISWVQKEKK